jgi:hypothetical protein
VPEPEQISPEIEVLFGRDRLMRSQIIYEAINLEAAVERIITFHFCPSADKQDLFVSLMFSEGQVSFSQKLAILRKLLKLCYPKLATAFKFLLDRLEKLRKLRNEFAHLRLDLPAAPSSTDLAAEEIRLRTLKDGKRDTRVVTREEVDRVVHDCRDLEVACILLAMAVQKTAKGEADAELFETTASLGQQIGKRLVARSAGGAV